MNPEDLGITADLASWRGESRLILSLGFVALVVGLRWLVIRAIRSRAPILSDNQRWWMTFVRNAATVVIVAGLLWLWAPELGDFALSITAFVVALVIATKELILNVSGAALRGATLNFGVGDWVRIGPHFGEVIDETLMSTVIQEVDPRELRYTGRTVAVPNAVLLATPVVNENFRKRFLHHEFTLHSEPHPRVGEIAEAIRAALASASDEFAQVARRYATVIEKAAGLQLPPTAPMVRVATTDLAKIAYRCTLFCPRERAMEMEQVALRAWLEAGGAGEVPRAEARERLEAR